MEKIEVNGSTKKGSFWTSLPGILTGLASIITAITGLYIALSENGMQDNVPTDNKPVIKIPHEPPGKNEPTGASIPNPQLIFKGTSPYEVRGRKFFRYNLSIKNWAEYSSELFASAPDLPPCGTNTNASRTWVDIYNAQNNARLYGYCALSSSQKLRTISFAVEQGKTLPRSVYIILKDRRKNITYRSNDVSVR
jgi:hypothetical protein